MPPRFQAMLAWSEAVAVRHAKAAALSRAQSWHRRKTLCACIGGLSDNVRCARVTRAKIGAIVMRSSAGVVVRVCMYVCV